MMRQARYPGFVVVSLALLAVAFAPVQAHEGTGACAANTTPTVTAASDALKAAPSSLETRFRLADAFIEANCFDEAVHTLEDGRALHPGNGALLAKLRTTRSMVSEQGYFAGLEQAEVGARVARNLLRCSRLGDLAACDEAVKLKPNDADVLIAKGDAQLTAGKSADAEQTYKRAAQLAPDNAKAASQLAVARAQRQAAVASCQAGSDDAALASCQSALLRGADDEFALNTRLAQIYQQRNQPGPALNSYIAANSLKRGDRNVALGIVALTDADSHRDAVTWAARGSALLTLKRGAEALAALNQAQTLAPGLPELRAQIAQAEALARSEPKPATASVASGAVVARVEPVPAVAAEPARRYSNAAEPSRSN